MMTLKCIRIWCSLKKCETVYSCWHLFWWKWHSISSVQQSRVESLLEECVCAYIRQMSAISQCMHTHPLNAIWMLIYSILFWVRIKWHSCKDHSCRAWGNYPMNDYVFSILAHTQARAYIALFIKTEYFNIYDNVYIEITLEYGLHWFSMKLVCIVKKKKNIFYSLFYLQMCLPVCTRANVTISAMKWCYLFLYVRWICECSNRLIK